MTTGHWWETDLFFGKDLLFKGKRYKNISKYIKCKGEDYETAFGQAFR